ncbi:hypothetical protein PG994_000040 [Apiospora phragmitis]|uniref:Uncharacterized protein n=1 Tax=Apiospora phragmitis TaxID=2905665 RepID=A0ABR1X557_9PEZI
MRRHNIPNQRQTQAAYLKKTVLTTTTHCQNPRHNNINNSRCRRRHQAQILNCYPPPLYQLSISRHIRTIYTPTVTHLRSYLSVFSPYSSSHGTTVIPPPPPSFRPPMARKPPHLILYGLVALHRDSSEWSTQGLGTTCAAVTEAGRRLGWRVEVIDPPPHSPSPSPLLSQHLHEHEHEHDHDPDQPLYDQVHDDGRRGRIRGEEALQELLREKLPILSGGIPLRPGLFDADEGGGWSGRAVEIGRVLSRWCQFSKGEWNEKLEVRGVEF